VAGTTDRSSVRHRFRARMEERGTYHRWVLWAALAGMFATTFPITILSVSLTDIAGEFDSSVSVLSWVIAAPMLLSALSVPILGKMGDLYGHRRVFLSGFACAVVVAGLTATAWDPASLIGFRSVAQVIGGATQPTSMALVMLVFAPRERVKALGWWSMTAAGAPAVGLVVGGPLVDLVGWRMIFVVQALLGLAALALAAVVLPESEPRRVRFDVRGAVTLSVAAGGAVFAFGQIGDWGLTHPVVLAAIVVVPLATATFVWVERRTEHPLLPLELLRIRNFTATLLTDFFQGAVYMGAFVLAPLALRDLYGMSATLAAAVMLLRTGVFAGASPVGGQMGARIGGRPTALLGTVILAGAMGVFVIGTGASSVTIFCVGLVVQGLGFGLARPPVTAALANAVPEHHLGLASALGRMSMQIGNAFGITLLSTLYDDSGTSSGFGPPFTAGIVLGIAAVLCAWLIREVRTEPERSDPDAMADPDPATID
jgi:EmrB/QacA subfamily drug resistance transporter